MDDTTVISLMVALFSLNYVALGAIWKKTNSITNAVKIICREHASNHGVKEIEI